VKLDFNDPRLKFKGLIVKFLTNGKVLAVPEGSGVHFTLHPGHRSGVIDFHKTNERLPSSDPSRHETLAAIPKEEIMRCLTRFGPNHVWDLLRLLRPIRIGWIARRRLGMVAFPTEPQLNSVSEIRIRASPPACFERRNDSMPIREFLEDIFEMPDTCFLLFDCKRPPPTMYGVLFKVIGPRGETVLYWIRLRDLRRWSNKMQVLFSELLGGLSEDHRSLF
jgi:hypothetical protein